MQCVKSRHPVSLRKTRVDEVASLLATAMLFMGTIVFVMSLVWLLEPQAREPQHSISLVGASSRSSSPMPSSMEIVEPADLTTNAREFSSELLHVLSSVNSVALDLHSTDETEAREQIDTRSQCDGHGSELAGELFGTSGDAGNSTPTHQRWQIVFQAADLKDYARQLDHFGIELGCVGGGIAEVEYASNLSTQPVRRSGAGDIEKRLHFSWRGNEQVFAAYDRQLLQTAGISTSHRLTLRFIPNELTKQLGQLELEYAKRHGRGDVSAITQTVFRSLRTESGYAFEVAGQLSIARAPSLKE